ncbi:MAG: hypothetical protein AB1390_11985, partial [Nitrospirota bacterium]
KNIDISNILFVLHNFHTRNMAGTELYTYNLAKSLHKKGFAVTILYPEFDITKPSADVKI